MIAAFFPAVVAALVDEQLATNGLAFFGATITAVLAYTLVSLQFVLAARFKWIERMFGASTVMRIHRSMAVVAMLLAVLHIALLIWHRGSWELLLFPSASWPIQLGRIAGLAMLITIGYSMGRKWIPINNADWKFFHAVLAWTILVSGFLHSMVLGSSFASPLFAIAWTGYFAVAIFSWLSRSPRRSRGADNARAVKAE
ncbi:MAG: ferric reductase-like transmembrane domain-containing protein [Aureliella sp.]